MLNVDSRQYEFGKDTFFYNWSKKYRPHDLDKFGIPQRYASEIYSVSPAEFNSQDIRNIVLLGASPTAPWIKRDFPGIGIALIRNVNQDGKKDEIPEIPGNKNIDLSDIVYFDKHPDGRIFHAEKQVKIASNTDGLTFINYTSSKNKEIEFVGHFFAATGLDPNTELTSAVPADRKLELSRKMAGEKGGWVASKNIPMGSLKQSFSLFMSQTRNVAHGHEPEAYHRDDFRSIFREAFKKEFCATIPDKFFDRIDRYILDSDTIDDRFPHFFIEELGKIVNKEQDIVLGKRLDVFAQKYIDMEYRQIVGDDNTTAGPSL